MAFGSRISAQIKFSLERMLGGGAFLQLLLAWAIVLLVAVTGGFLAYFLARGEFALTEEFWWSFLRLTDPGYLGDDEGLGRRIISTILTVAGYVLFMGTLVAIMTQWLFRQMRNFELGQTPVSFRNHTVLLGWTSRTLPIVRELLSPVIPRATVNKIAVLADDITAGPTAEVRGEHISGKDRRRIVLRSGSLLNPEHLTRVAIENARTIIIPSRSNFAEQTLSADADIIKVLLSLHTQFKGRQGPRVIAELQDARKVPVALHTYKGYLQLIASDLIISRILLRSILYPGLSGVVNALLIDPNQAQFMPESAARLVGKNWQQVFASSNTATPCGVLRPTRNAQKRDECETLLAPAGDLKIKEGDEILYLALNYSDIHTHQRAVGYRVQKMNEKLIAPIRPLQRKVLILGWSNRVLTLLAEMANDDRTQFSVCNVSTTPLNERELLFAERQLEGSGQLQVEWLRADYTTESAMQKLQAHHFDSVILFSSDRLASGEEADARSIVAFMVLDYLLAKGNPSLRPHIMVELHDPSNAAYVNHSHNEVLVSSVIVSHVLAQVAVYPQLRAVYEQLLSADGARLALRFLPANSHRVFTIGELRELALSEQAVLLGYQQEGGETVLNPNLNAQVQVNEGTQLIILQGPINE
ncbi:hypothetical protein [Aliidiomarina sp.]|uniref:hypothetical protein n=1 Tax=Aliidiomarina sp. TaxID=1872439 RepID=UPI003A4E19C3